MNNYGTIILEVPHRHSADLLCNDMVQRAELCQDKNLQPMSMAGPAHLGKEILKRVVWHQPSPYNCCSVLSSPKPFLASAWKQSPMLYLAQEPGSQGMPWWECHKESRSSRLDEQDPRQDLKEIMSFILFLCLPVHVSKSGSTGFVWLLA